VMCLMSKAVNTMHAQSNGRLLWHATHPSEENALKPGVAGGVCKTCCCPMGSGAAKDCGNKVLNRANRASDRHCAFSTREGCRVGSVTAMSGSGVASSLSLANMASATADAAAAMACCSC